MFKAIDKLQKKGLLRIIEEPLDIDLEIPHVAYVEAKKEDSKALLFTKPISKRLNKSYDIPVLMNTFCSFEAMEMFLGKHPDTIAKDIESLLHMKTPNSIVDKMGMFTSLFYLKDIFPKRLKDKTDSPSQEVVKLGKEVDLYELPILTTWDDDGGPFITMGQVYTQSLDGTKHNLGMYRLQVYDKKRLGLHWQIHKDGMHFFNEYKKAGKKMPVSVAIGGDPLYIWCGQAPLPYGIFELLLYGFIKSDGAKLVKSLTNPIFIPMDADFVIEGWVNPEETELEGPFGDHTGFYTPKEPYPFMEVSAITHKSNPVYHATVVGKPPVEDKYMGWATERIFLPLLKTTTPDLIDYCMPENGVFHNLILAKMEPKYPGHAKQFMHAFWGVGQMSFVKHAIFVDEEAPDLRDYQKIADYICNHFTPKSILISEGICDALDHSSENACYGGKLGIDCTLKENNQESKNILSDSELLQKSQSLLSEIKSLKQYQVHTKTPIVVFSIDKSKKVKDLHKKLESLDINTSVMIFIDHENNDLTNPYMLIWRIVNNIDAMRDVFVSDKLVCINATKKGKQDGYKRSWPEDVMCNKKVLDSLINRNLIDLDEYYLRNL